MIQVKINYPMVLLVVLFPLSLTAQQPGRKELQDLYQDVLHPSEAFLNGREYKYYFNPRLPTPLIPQDLSPSASVVIRKQLYRNVMLLYDAYKDLVLYYDPKKLYNEMITTVIVNKYIIEEFTLQLPSGQARFKYLTFKADQERLLSSGFYEIVSEGACKFIIDHSAVKKTQDGGVVYLYKTEWYIISSGAIYRIKGKKSLLKALFDRATEVNEYLKRTKIRVREADKEQIKGVVDFYTGLKQS
jgi:hypothetical protein